MSDERGKLLSEINQGHQSALEQFVALERDQLFDYLVRMTGQIDRSASCLDEVISVFRVNGQTYASVNELRIRLYSTARNFCADIWRNDTSKLVHPQLGSGVKASSAVSPEQLQGIELTLMAAATEVKEFAQLCFRSGFSLDHAEKIMGQSVYDESWNSFQKAIAVQLEQGASIEEALRALPNYRMEEPSHSHVTDLSMVIGDLRKSKRFNMRDHWGKILVSLFLVGALALWYLGILP